MSDESYKHREIEPKWREYWISNRLHEARDEDPRPKYYCLDMFPYPSSPGSTWATGAVTSFRIAGRDTNGCKATRFYIRWVGTRLGRLPRTMPFRKGFTRLSERSAMSKISSGSSMKSAPCTTGPARSIQPTPSITSGHNGSS